MTFHVKSAVLMLVLCANSLSAQVATTTESGIVCPSGQSQFPVEVTGANGVNYYCREDTNIVNGVLSRVCRRASQFGTTAGTTTGLTGLGGLTTTTGIGLALGAVALVGALTQAQSGSSNTPGTN
ncbi:hypothetical protein [Planktotalea sp.]|uniref:hypothetical protein n=1 Tax=Planktotalea sp. TaxID=2029877 RepID=UPI0025DBFD0F|nr:hypothetical protein [Planktotalea sp.]